MKVTRPVMRYHGGKWRLAPWVIANFPRHRTYTETYGGAGSVLLRKPRSYAEIYNDLAGEVVNLFRLLRDPHDASRLAELVALTPFAREEFSLAFVACDDPMERGRRLLVRSYMGHGSTAFNRKSTTGFRADADRRGSTPAHDWENFAGAIRAISERLRGVVIECRPAADVIRQYDRPDTLHYVDPPYVHSTRNSDVRRSRGYIHEMDDDAHRDLAAVLRSAVGKVVVSGYPCELYAVELYPDWVRVECHATADGGAGRTECLWMNPAAVRALPQPGLIFGS